MPSKISHRVFPLLHIDHNPDDRSLIQEAIRATEIPFQYHGVDGIQAAVGYFRQSAIEQFPFPLRPHDTLEHPRPALILLDYDFGIHCGTDFLYWLRTLHGNTAIPVVLYSGSVSEGQVGEGQVSDCYANGATHFLRKAQSVSRIQTVVRTLHLCFTLPTPRFKYLAGLAESEPDHRIAQPVLN